MGRKPLASTATLTLLAVLLATAAVAISYYAFAEIHATLRYQITIAIVVTCLAMPFFLYPQLRAQQRLRILNRLVSRLAATDELTELPNRRALTAAIPQLLADQPPSANRMLAVMVVEVSELNTHYNRHGLQAGDELVRCIANRLRRALGGTTYCARISGNTFMVLQGDVASMTHALSIAEHLSAELEPAYHVEKREITPRFQVGVALAPLHGSNVDELMRAADIALQEAQEQSRTIAVFSPAVCRRLSENADIEMRLNRALFEDAITLEYQPVFRKNTLTVTSCEALFRLPEELNGGYSTGRFIEIAEKSGLIVKIGDWVLNDAVRQAAAWPIDARIAVNISALQLRRSDICNSVERALERWQLRPDLLELEVTETAVIEDLDRIGRQLNRIRNMGVRVALDDFGSGYCGIPYLQGFEVDRLKLDASLINRALACPRSQSILCGISEIAQRLQVDVTAEGIDSPQKLEMLRNMAGVTDIQGFLLSRPLKPQSLTRLVSHCRGGATQDAATGNVIRLGAQQ